MKYILIFASVVLINFGQSAPTTSTTEVSVADHIEDIVSLIPKELIRNITYEHLRTDEEFKAAVKYMQTDEWNKRVQIIREKPEWIALKNHIKSFGINIDKFIKCIDGLLQNVTIKIDPKKPSSKKSVRAFLIDVEQSLPTMKILTTINEKMMKHPELQDVFSRISSDETRRMFDDVLSITEIKSMLKDLADMDLNIVDALYLIYTFMGWGELKLQQ